MGILESIRQNNEFCRRYIISYIKLNLTYWTTLCHAVFSKTLPIGQHYAMLYLVKPYLLDNIMPCCIKLNLTYWTTLCHAVFS